MPRIRLLHWSAREAAAHVEILRQSGHQVDYDEQFRPALLKNWREFPPAAFVIDLSRLPSHGREIAVALRQSPRTRLIPIVFCGGLEHKINAIRSILPDAMYCTIPELERTVQNALRERPAHPVKPPAMMDRYKGRTTAEKLGILDSSTVALVDPPANAL